MHKFHVRQLVQLARAGFSDGRSTADGLYEVIRLMPADQTGEASYRIRPARASGITAGGERAVRESEITARVVPS